MKQLKPGTGCLDHTHYDGCGCSERRLCCGCPPPVWVETDVPTTEQTVGVTDEHSAAIMDAFAHLKGSRNDVEWTRRMTNVIAAIRADERRKYQPPPAQTPSHANSLLTEMREGGYCLRDDCRCLYARIGAFLTSLTSSPAQTPSVAQTTSTVELARETLHAALGHVRGQLIDAYGAAVRAEPTQAKDQDVSRSDQPQQSNSGPDPRGYDRGRS